MIASTNRAVPGMEAGPPGSPCRRSLQTAAVSCRLRAGVGSDCGKGPQSAGQVSDEKTNVGKPLLTQRKVQMSSKPGKLLISGTSEGAACVWPWRCPVYRWREL